jgi:hypothetical protein
MSGSGSSFRIAAVTSKPSMKRSAMIVSSYCAAVS